MIKSNYKLFIGIIIGIIFTSTTVFAANSLLAQNVSYKPSSDNFNVDNVSDALDKLYTKATTPIYLTDYKVLDKLPEGWGGTFLKSTITTVDANSINLTCKDSPGNTQGGVYLKIDNIEKYKYFVITVSGLAGSFHIGVSDQITSNYDLTNKSNFIKYSSTNNQEFDTSIHYDVSNMSGTKYLILAGTYYDVKISTKAYQY